MNLLARRFGCLGPMAIAAFATVVTAAEQLGTGFTYQGQLKSQGIPLEGDVDLEFTLWDAATGGATVAVADAHPGVDVVTGCSRFNLISAAPLSRAMPGGSRLP